MSLFRTNFAELIILNVGKRYGSELVLDQVTMAVRSGEIVGLLGPNGAGKTTLMKILIGLTSATSGVITLDGWELNRRRKEAHLRIGIVPQESNLEKNLTVLEALTSYGWLFGVRDPHEKIKKLAQLFEFEDMLCKLASTLSGGYTRRVLIARSLLSEPDIILMDEPSVGLDPDVRHQLWDIIKTLRKEGKGILLTTHYMEEAENLCDKIYFLRHGKIVWKGTPLDSRKQFSGLEDLFLELVREGEGKR